MVTGHVTGPPLDESQEAEETRALWQLARDASALHRLAENTPAILEMVQGREDRRTFRHELRRITHWDDGVGSAFKALAVAAIGALTLYAAAHFFNSTPPQLPPSLPPVTAPPTPSVAPHTPVVTP